MRHPGGPSSSSIFAATNKAVGFPGGARHPRSRLTALIVDIYPIQVIFRSAIRGLFISSEQVGETGHGGKHTESIQ
jgi:hypothetical protein